MRDRSRPSPFLGPASSYGLFEPRVDPTVTTRRLDPAQLLAAPPAPRCVRCGRLIDDEPVATPLGSWHAVCRPAPAPDPAPVVVVLPRRVQLRDQGPRRTHLTVRDQERVLAWLLEHGPATSRMVAWALNVPDREVQLQLRALEGVSVEPIGVVKTGRRGHPPTVWRVREAIAA